MGADLKAFGKAVMENHPWAKYWRGGGEKTTPAAAALKDVSEPEPEEEAEAARIEATRLGISDLGRSIQDALIDAEKKQLDQKRNSILERQAAIQERIAAAVENDEANPATLE
jgi:hypothetical protein